MNEQDEPRSERGHATPEDDMAEAPAATEIGEPGTPGAGMTPDVPHAADADLMEHGDAAADPVAHGAVVDASAASVAHHDAATHMDAHTSISDDDHGHAQAALGPIDWAAWGYAIVGGVLGLIVVAVFWVAVN
ncbi:MAG: hypothetical protein ABIP53_09075 [Candidatus Limnocylindrales bacterium]